MSYDDLILEKHLGRIIPAKPSLAIASYIKDYRISKVKKEYVIHTRMFFSDNWHKSMSFDSKYKDIAKYLRDTNKKESVLFVTNGMIDRGSLPIRTFGLVVSAKIENVRNINRMIRT